MKYILLVATSIFSFIFASTATIELEQINQALEDMEAGVNARGVILFG